MLTHASSVQPNMAHTPALPPMVFCVQSVFMQAPPCMVKHRTLQILRALNPSQFNALHIPSSVYMATQSLVKFVIAQQSQ